MAMSDDLIQHLFGIASVLVMAAMVWSQLKDE